ncbi:Conserved_hypothetical protein [Hexamita inflata]|uniref:Uncharacterized protein n=1 Tax=Hexamita inflata TaxID=28002 RepID=A0AA86UG53_9EUKA|nr:Conserved hypothetical protein [Hexamita inflata]
MQYQKGNQIINTIQWMHNIADFIYNYKNTEEHSKNLLSSSLVMHLNLWTHSNQIFQISSENGTMTANPLHQADEQLVKAGEIFLLGLNDNSQFIKMEIGSQNAYETNINNNSFNQSKTQEALLGETQSILSQNTIGLVDQTTALDVKSFTDAVVQPMKSLKEVSTSWERHLKTIQEIQYEDQFEVIEGFKQKKKLFGSLEAFKYLKDQDPEYGAVKMFKQLKQCIIDLCDMSVINQCCYKEEIMNILSSYEFDLDQLMLKPHVQLLERITRLHQIVLSFKNSNVKLFDFESLELHLNSKFSQTQHLLTQSRLKMTNNITLLQYQQTNLVKQFCEAFNSQAMQ